MLQTLNRGLAVRVEKVHLQSYEERSRVQAKSMPG
jgi:hypothetical protein